MARRPKYTYEVVAAFDTETTNYADGECAFPVLYIYNDLTGVDFYNYTPGKDDEVHLYRTEDEMLERLSETIVLGIRRGRVPIVTAYNLMFDLQSLMKRLSEAFDIRANAQSSTNVYTMDLYEHGAFVAEEHPRPLLRFWDTFHLEMGGLAAMGKTAGLPKAMGDWDYSLVRTQETPLTDEESFYAGRDTQVIPMYLRYLLRANEWLSPLELGTRLVTKTSVVRQMARHQIGNLRVTKSNGKDISLDKMMLETCKQEDAKYYASYALRKACFRGGFTFTAAAYASTIAHDVASLDVTSMHHTFINGRFVPLGFECCTNESLLTQCERVAAVPYERVLERYWQPFDVAFHARIKLTNIRLRRGSCFEHWGIALAPHSKFQGELEECDEFDDDPRNIESENDVRAHGWHDMYQNAEFAFGKLYRANAVIVDVSELELWCMAQVYEWDSMVVLYGEAATKFRRPPDYVTLQSNVLFELKTRAKRINKFLENSPEGTPYTGDLTGIPEGIARDLREGTCSRQFFESWYIGTVKGMFNGIYGTQAQDVRKPSYEVEEGELVIDPDTRITDTTFDTHETRSGRVLYTYGLRIVGGSRMHMVISLMLLWKAFGDRVDVLGGDTDSMKVACHGVTDEALAEAMAPIADASKRAIDKTMERVRRCFPDLASPLTGIGSFDIENAGQHYDTHLELWNKCRVSWDGHAHVTCAGLSRPEGKVHMGTVIEALVRAGYPVADVLDACMGYNVTVTASVGHALGHSRPAVSDVFEGDVTDYRGVTSHVRAHRATYLYPVAREMGDTNKYSNFTSFTYLLSHYGREVNDAERYVGCSDGKVWVKLLDGTTIMEASL